MAESKLLGIKWDSLNDDLLFNVAEILQFAEEQFSTKRNILKIAASVFDPLGILSPFTIHIKILFQQLCACKTDWDEPLMGENLHTSVESYCE